MGRVYDSIEVNDIPLHTLFDSGSRRSYIAGAATRSAGLEVRALRVSFEVGLGGETRSLREYCHVEGKLYTFDIDFTAYLVDSLGVDERRNRIDMVFGAHDMQSWQIGIDMDRESLDLSNFTRDFTEF